MPVGSSKVEPFKKNPRQREALDLINKHKHALLYGGSRSGKTFIIIRNIVLRALKKPSRHLILRLRFNHVKVSIWHDTFPKVMRTCFPHIPYKENKTDWFVTIPCRDGGESQIWFAGADDPARVERVLGNEYSTIFANEISQIAWETILVMWTRLAENVGLALRFYYDCNPPNKRHWSYTMFFKGESPKKEKLMAKNMATGEMEPLDVAHMRMNPTDNPHLSDDYLSILHSLPERQRKRFLEGQFLADVEGALWDLDAITRMKMRPAGDVVDTCVAIDPSVSSTEDADECGIIVASGDRRDGKRGMVVHEDASDQLSTQKWAARAVDLYHQYRANVIVAEGNQGGDLVKDVIHNIDPNIVVEIVHARRSKFARAEPVAQLSDEDQDRVSWDTDFPELEDELTTYVPRDANYSPNRLDAFVWAGTYLVLDPEGEFFIGSG